MLQLIYRCRLLITSAFLSLFLASCSSLSIKNTTQDDLPIPSSNPSDFIEFTPDLPSVLAELAQYRVVLVGEQHDRLDHHVLQLDVIEYLHSLESPIAIGLEFFQQPFQSVLDAYVAGDIDEQEMLEQTEYFKRWVYDYRLYAPILRFARQNQIPLIALNIPGEIVRKTSREGLDSLNEQESLYVPQEINRDVEGYEERIRASFLEHEGVELGMLENFIDAQLLWDEGMAEKAANYLFDQPERLLVILAGTGHIEYRTGIPVRLERRVFSPVATVLPLSRDETRDDDRADYQIESNEIALPAKGLMGVLLDESERGIYALSFTPDSAAEKAGVLPGDFLRTINASTIREYADIKLALWDANKGETVKLTVERRTADSNDVLEFRLTLQ